MPAPGAEWIVLGSGTISSRAGRSAAGYAARVGDAHLVFDTGPGKLLRMAEAGVPYEHLSHIFYTHLHPDHCADLLAILFARTVLGISAPGLPHSRRLHLWGPQGFEEHYAGLRALHGRWVEGEGYELLVRRFPGELQGEEGGLPWRVTSRLVQHIPGAQGFRLEAAGGSLAYSGDTDYCQGIVDLCRDVGLAVLECSTPDEDHVSGHLTPRLCGRIAREAGARRLLLTHFYPPCEEIDVAALAAREYDGPILVAEDLMRVPI